MLGAARQLLLDVGYVGMSIELIAQRAGVTRPAIYRRWPTLAHLVHNAVFGADQVVTVADTGDFRADLAELARSIATTYSRPEVQAALAGMLSDLHGHPAMRASVIDGLEGQLRAEFRRVMDRAVDRGDVRMVEADLVVDTLIGALFHSAMSGRRALDSFVVALVELLLDGLAVNR